MYSACLYETPLVGEITLAAGEDGLKGLWLSGQKYFGGTLDGPMEVGPAKANPHLVKTCAWLDRYFASERPKISELTIAPIGTEFRQVIWKLLCEIPEGETSTYGTLGAEAAKILGKDHMAALAVGGAVGHNPISIIIPCHRVVGATGSLTGYAGGINRKLALLRHEGVDTSKLTIPKRGTAL